MSVLTLSIPRQLRRKAPESKPGELWHVSVTRPGLFPQAEIGCPCVKARCGHVIPHADIICRVHTGSCAIFQAHPESQCRPTRPGWRLRPRRR